MEHIINVNFGQAKVTETEYRYQYDYGQILMFEDLALPTAYEVHFSNDLTGTSMTSIGDAEGVLIPDEYFLNGKDIYAWVFLHDEETDGRTMYRVRIPVKKRPQISEAQPTPVEHDVITQAIAALNDAVERTDASVEDARESAQSAQENADLTEGYLNDAISAKDDAEAARDRAILAETNAGAFAVAADGSAQEAEQSAEDSEAWAVGKRNGVDVGTTDPTYHNNSKYHAEQASEKSSEASASASSAATSASSANTSAQAAATSATAASESASNASNSATDSANSASDAANSASNASASAQTATDKASEASASATEAEDSASDAAGSASDAADSAELATTKANAAASSASAAASSASSASASASSAASAAANAAREAAQEAVAPLQAELDEAISGVTEDSEVINARVGADATTYSTLKQRLDAENADLKNQINWNAIPIVNTASGATASFSDGADDVPVRDLVVNIDPVQSGSGDPSPDNVRPISGWTGMNVQRTGKNLSSVEQLVQTPYWGYDAQALVGLVNTLPVGTYTFSYKAKILTLPDSGSTMHGPFYITAMINGSQVPVSAYRSTTDNSPTVGKVYNESTTFTITDENKGKCNHVYAYCDSSVHTGSGRGNYQIYDIQLELGTTATSYEPYQGNTYSVNWETEAGTVYGGTLDVTTGVLTVDRVCHTYEGGTDNVINERSLDTNNKCLSIRANAFRHVSTSNGTAGTSEVKPMCNILPIVNFDALRTNTGNVFTSQGNWPPALAIQIQGLNTIEEYDAWCAENKPQISWLLATPQTYQLTPTEVKTLLQNNNIFADTGDIASVEYVADTKTYIDNKFAELQALVLENT